MQREVVIVAKVLVLFAHPAQHNSRINRLLARSAKYTDGVTFVDLYAEYPRFKIDVDREQDRLLDHDVIVFQFPVYWYSTPAILKEWQDLVLEFGWAYGPNGNKLHGKQLVVAVTLGGAEDAYGQGGQNKFELRTLLTPLEATANLCGMEFVPPFALFASHHAREEGRDAIHLKAYRSLLIALRDGSFVPGNGPLTTPTDLPAREGA